MIFALSCSLHCVIFLCDSFFLSYSLYKTIYRSRLSPSFLSSLTCWQQLKFHLFAKCFYLQLNKKKSIDKHARKWCRRAASSPRLRLPLTMFIWSFNFMQWKDIHTRKKSDWLTFVCINMLRVLRCIMYMNMYLSSVNKYWTKTITKTRE